MNPDDLSLLGEFKNLKRGDRVYSRQYGVGKVQSLYREDEVIVQFADIRKRISVDDGLSKVPEDYFKKPKKGPIKVEYKSKSISFKEFKKLNRADRERKKFEEKVNQYKKKQYLKKEIMSKPTVKGKDLQIELEFSQEFKNKKLN